MEKLRIRLNSVQFQSKLPVGAELGNMLTRVMKFPDRWVQFYIQTRGSLVHTQTILVAFSGEDGEV